MNEKKEALEQEQKTRCASFMLEMIKKYGAKVLDEEKAKKVA